MRRSPMLASLTRHKLTVMLLVLQVAFTCAIVCNVASMIGHRTAQMHEASGVAEDELVTLESISVDEHDDPLVRHNSDLAALRQIPGVISAVAVDALPLNSNNWSNGIATRPAGNPALTATAFNGTPGERQTLGLRLIAGRDFLPDEYMPIDSAHDWSGINHVAATIVTRALAEQLFPGQDPLGKLIYPGDGPVRIVGVVDHLLRPTLDESAGNEYSTLLPLLPDTGNVTYVLRTDPNERERVLKQATDVLTRLDNNRVLRHAQTFEQLRADYFSRDRSMIGLLLAAAGALLLVTAAGIAGLASFWVQQRKQAIGIRRAVGATRDNILHYFQLENFLIVSGGVVLGVVLAFVLNLELMQRYTMQRLPWIYLPMGAIALWLLGQLAVLGPALRAAAVPPVVATRGG
ncbi:ABC transporter permease [Dyella humicola]|uniref:ABC transporter permease n=1 Tax=Dyella humicola TaxID=2992126 RepID=UPI00224D1AD9|nr:FtsX-like permease family protein [Dyella humicola]